MSNCFSRIKKDVTHFFLVKVNPHRRYRIYLYMYIPVSMGITETSSFITLAPIFTNIDLCLFDTVSITCIPQYLFLKIIFSIQRKQNRRSLEQFNLILSLSKSITTCLFTTVYDATRITKFLLRITQNPHTFELTSLQVWIFNTITLHTKGEGRQYMVFAQ